MLLSGKLSYPSLLIDWFCFCFLLDWVIIFIFDDVVSYSGPWFCNQPCTCNLLCLLRSEGVAA